MWGGGEALCKDESHRACTWTCPMRLKPLSAPWFADTSPECLGELTCMRGSRSSNSFTGEELPYEGRLWKSRRICTSRNRLLVSCHAGSCWWSRNLTSSQLNKSQPSVWTTRIDFFLKYPQSLNAFVKFLSLCTQCQPQLNNEGSPRKLLTYKQPMLPVMKATSYCLVYWFCSCGAL